MEKQQARRVIKETFEQPFNKPRFTRFIKNLLNKVDESKAFHARGDVKESFRNVIKTYERIGTYDSPNGEKLDLIIVYLQRTFSIHHARVTQRNFAGKYLADRGQKDAGLFAFVSPDEADWRFSLVKMDYKFEQTATGKVKVKEEFTPARRWSFLVGANEKSHTAQSRLVKILANDEQAPILAELEEAFNIETVTKKFFSEYRDLFVRTKENLDKLVKNNASIKTDFEAKGVNAVDFAKKLLGQIVFLYFLQKKGWFGVGRDADWGDGSKQFLRELFEKKYGSYANFFNDILEPLFYEALRNDRSHDDDYYSRFNCKIPFLNGGLFDPIGNYDWVHTDIHLPDNLFSNKTRTKEGDIGDGILDVFDRYNFTVKEDEPLEKEVAIDPELLGKAYEKFNAIRPDNFEEYKKALKSGKKGDESKFNKQFGVYYTPREIVHYMCQQSLINYLFTELNSGQINFEKLGENNLDMFGNKVKQGQWDLTIEHRANPEIKKEDIETLIHYGEQVSENEARVESKGKETSSYSYQLPESIRNNAEMIDRKLAEITVCDPAVGSGAFPVGMMSEIVKARNVLSIFNQAEKRTPYDFKRQCIEHSLYGVDIDPGAVEIAKLRLWLSLVVDEDDIKNIKPLPNLDYKIMCGNSLLGVEKNLFNNELFKELERLKPLHFNETNPTKKKEYKDKIDALILQITNGHKEFDFGVYFSEVFHEKGGFDVVIGNPPYVNSGKITNLKPALKREYGSFYSGTADLYTFFIKKGLDDLACSTGLLCYITSNKYMRAGYGKNTRELLIKNATPSIIIDFGELPVFEAATDPSIILASKAPKNDSCFTAITIKTEEEISRISDVVRERGFSMLHSALSSQSWILENQAVLHLKKKLKQAGIPLGKYIEDQIYRGIVTGLNKAFIIDEETKNRLIVEDIGSQDLIKPWLDGNEIKRWYADWGGSYVIFTRQGTDIEKYPALKSYLSQFRKDLEPKRKEEQIHGRKPGKYKWYEIQDNIAYYENFSKTKLVYNETSKELHAFIDNEELYINKTGFIILSDDNEYLLGLLNSKLMDWYYRVDFPTYGDPWKGGRIQFRKDPNMLGVPIVLARAAFKFTIVRLVRKILPLTQSDDYLQNRAKQAQVKAYEKQIDQMVYELYDLTAEEINTVEGGK